MDKRGGVIVKIDGIDGCGKSTLVENLYARYKKQMRVSTTREYGNDQDNQVTTNGQSGTVSRILCEIALNPRLQFDSIEKSLMLSVVERRQNRLVLPRLRDEFDLILSDRSSLSRAYEWDLGRSYETLLQWMLEPLLEEDWVLWIDVDPKVAFQRANHNTAFVFEDYGEDSVEKQGLENLFKVAEAYRTLASQRPNVIRLDGNVSIDELAEAAAGHIEKLLHNARI